MLLFGCHFSMMFGEHVNEDSLVWRTFYPRFVNAVTLENHLLLPLHLGNIYKVSRGVAVCVAIGKNGLDDVIKERTWYKND